MRRGWEVKRLGELSDQITDGTHNSPPYVEAGIPMLDSKHVKDGFMIDDSEPEKFISPDTDALLAKRCKPRTGDILISSRGSIGKIAIVREGQDFNIMGNMILIRLPAGVSRQFAAFYLQSKVSHIESIAHGVAQKGLYLNQIRDYELPLPPLPEQQRIASILDQAEELRRLRQRAIDRLNELGRSIFDEMFGNPATNPKNLPTRPLGEMIKVSSGLGLTSANQSGGDYPVYGGNGINGWHNEYTVPSGTIVIGRVGVYCGAVHVTAKDAWVTDNALIVTKKKADLNTPYLAAALKYANLNQYAGRSAQPLVSGSRIYPIHIAVPTNGDQSRFESRMIKHAKLVDDFSADLSTLDRLFSCLQTRAFRGEL